MTDTYLPTDFIGLLAGHLAKLNQQLRLLLADDQGAAAGGMAQPGPAHSVLSRLRVASNLLVDPQMFHGERQKSWRQLGLALGDLVSELQKNPGRLPVYLLSPLEQMADYLSEVFTRMDTGESNVDLCHDPRWEALLGAFINAGTVLQVLDEMEDRMQNWSQRFGDQDLSASQEEFLQRRWTMLRQYGDSLFGTTEGPLLELAGKSNPDHELSGRRVMLLLDSPFRKAQLGEHLRDAGCTVEYADSAVGMMARVADPLPPEILLCDNLEPSLHLTAVRGQLKALELSPQLPLVLVATTGGSASALRERAQRLGVQWTWAEPFRLADLAAANGKDQCGAGGSGCCYRLVAVACGMQCRADSSCILHSTRGPRCSP